MIKAMLLVTKGDAALAPVCVCGFGPRLADDVRVRVGEAVRRVCVAGFWKVEACWNVFNDGGYMYEGGADGGYLKHLRDGE